MNRTIVSILCLVSAFTFAEETAILPIETAKVETAPADLIDASTSQKVLEASEATVFSWQKHPNTRHQLRYRQNCARVQRCSPRP